MSAKPTVFVVDDDRDVREFLKWLLESINVSVETFDSADTFLKAYRVGSPGCLVLDVRMPGMSGVRLLEHLHKDGSRMPVILLTAHGDIQMAVHAMQIGAFDFFEKPFLGQRMLDRVQDALRWEEDNRRTHAERDAIAAQLRHLTPREREVLERLVNGKPVKAIAIELAISNKTVETYRARIFEKMGTNSLAKLVRMTLLARDWSSGSTASR